MIQDTFSAVNGNVQQDTYFIPKLYFSSAPLPEFRDNINYFHKLILKFTTTHFMLTE